MKKPHKAHKQQQEVTQPLQENKDKDNLKKEQLRNKYLLKKYGITLAEYLNKLDEQQGCCAICHQPPKKFKLCVDHLHKKDRKGKQIVGDRSLVRGLVCFFCNKYIIGALERRNKLKGCDVAVSAAIYLTRWYTDMGIK